MLSFIVLPIYSAPLNHVSVWASTAASVSASTFDFLPDFFEWLFKTPKKSAARQETVESRSARVSRIRITPNRFVGYLNESQTFTAIGLDASREIVHGAKFTWESSDTYKLTIDETGRVTFLQPGIARIICRASNKQAEVQVLIRPIRRPRQNDVEWNADQESLALPNPDTGVGMLNISPFEKLIPTAHAQGYLGTDMGQSAPVNAVGNPRHAPIEQTRLGSVMGNNFNVGFPLVSLGGRGLTTNLTLYYNSNVWGARFDPVLNTTVYTFDPIQSWPSPGFTLGFGRIAFYDLQCPSNCTNALMLVDPDGTRHYLGRVSQSTPATLQTNDGTHITYIGDVVDGGMLYYRNGTKVSIGFVNNRLLPTQITEPNGNYIQIAYKSTTQGFAPMAIDHITDTLGRVISFTYNGTQLSGVSTPDGSGGTFSYQTVTMNTNFQNGVVTENVGANFQGISGVSCTNRPPYSLTYSGYGMVYNVAWASGGVSGSVAYNYPTGGEELYGGVTFTQRTETATNAPTGVYTYSTDGIIRPDGSVLRITGSESELKTSTGTTVSKAVYTYANDPGGQPQVQSVITYDDTNTPTKVDYDYDQYGNVTNKREYGNQISGQWKVRRRTKTTYINYQQYLDSYITDLPMRVEVFDALENTNDADDVLVQKTEYQYDAGSLTSYSGANPPGYSATYVSSARGNQTGTTQYTNLSGAGTSITSTDSYDVFGNVVKAQVACCNEKSYTFGANTYWSEAEHLTNGSTTGTHLTSSMEYNFSSGTLSKRDDPNGQITSYSYGSSGLLWSSVRHTGATTSTSYDAWGSPTSFTESYVEGGLTKNLTSTTVYNGFGQPIQETNIYGGQVNITYDNMGREQSRTNPFPQGGTPAPATIYQYDVLNRITTITTPDGNVSQITYNGKETTHTNQVNQRTKREVDSLGRLIKITEQDITTGNLTQFTTYTYDMADRRLQINQGGQIRSFKYDAAGRLLFEKIPEQTATINDGTGTYWTTKYTYTDFNRIATKTDARGVITTYTYDTLNRLTQISYNVGATGVPATPSVTYTFDNNQTSATKGYLLSVTVGSNYSESYTYNVGSGGSGGTDISETSVAYTIEGKSYTANFQHNQAEHHLQFGHMYYEYDMLGRLSAVKNSAGVAWINNFAYNVAGQITGNTLNTSGTVVNETFGYDANRSQFITHTATKGATSLMSMTYIYTATAGQNGTGSSAGNNGQVMSISGTMAGVPAKGGGGGGPVTESAGFTYDLLGRLTTSNQTTNNASAQQRFAYDRWGNRTGVWDAVTGGNQIQAISLQQSGGAATNRITSVTQGSTTWNYPYDNVGNVTNDGVHAYQYDAENRVVSIDNGTTAQYSYNHRHQRVKRATGGATTHYVCHKTGVLAEYNGTTGALLAQYVTLGGRQIARIEGGVTSFFLNDSLSTRVVLNAGGTVIGRQGHLPYGEALGMSGTTDKHGFTSYERDTEVGNDYGWNRRYANGVGKFMSADPYRASGGAENPQSWNRYSYTMNNPVNFVDPTGLLLGYPSEPGSGEPPPCYFGGNGGDGENQDEHLCNIFVMFRFLTAWGAYHGFILTAVDGGFPDVPTDYFGATREGTRLVGIKGPYTREVADDDFAGGKLGERYTMPGTCEFFNGRFGAVVDLINSHNLTYNPLLLNSNTLVSAALRSAGINPPKAKHFKKKGISPIPGWNTDLPIN